MSAREETARALTVAVARRDAALVYGAATNAELLAAKAALDSTQAAYDDARKARK